ncbi:MAG: Smr/MutS family protein [Sandaracinaceae bacterium]|nr:Smr/MutS family protein [Sandaracinaceae bacterium]
MRKHASAESSLDLHGLRASEAEAEVARFVRREHRRGVRRVCIVHGKGLHSEGGVGVLADRVVRALTEGLAAPLVVAFATAPADLGGTGALLVELAR